MSDREEFDLEDVYDSKISPLMTQIIEICRENNMPMFASFLFRDTEKDGKGFCTTNIPRLLPNGKEDCPEAFLECFRAVRRPAHQAFAITVTSPKA